MPESAKAKQIAELEEEYNHLSVEIKAAHEYLPRVDADSDNPNEYAEAEALEDIERWESDQTRIGEELRKLRNR